MTCHSIDNFSANAWRQGTASLGRIKPILSLGRLERVVNHPMFGVETYSQGGRTP